MDICGAALESFGLTWRGFETLPPHHIRPSFDSLDFLSNTKSSRGNLLPKFKLHNPKY